MVKNQDQDENTGLNSEDEYPRPKVSPILKWSIIIMSALIVILLTIVISTIIYRAVKSDGKNSGKKPSTQGFGTVELEVPAGSKIGNVTLDGSKATIVINRTSGGDEIVIINVRSGAIIGRIQLKEK